MACVAECCAITETMCLREINPQVHEVAHPCRPECLPPRMNVGRHARWWDRDEADLAEDILSDTDEGLACADGAQVSRKRSLQWTSNQF